MRFLYFFLFALAYVPAWGIGLISTKIFDNFLLVKDNNYYLFFNDNKNTILIAVGLIIFHFIFYFVQEHFFNKKYNNTLMENERLKNENEIIITNYAYFIDGYLYQLSNNLNLSSDERITLYVHDGNNMFFPCARYSCNEKYRKIKKDKYSDQKGCISKGWGIGWYFDNQFPDDNKKYIARHVKEYGLSEEEVKDFTMKSKLYSVFRINEEQRSVAIIVIESTNVNKFEENYLKERLHKECEYIRYMIKILDKHIPRPTIQSRSQGV